MTKDTPSADLAITGGTSVATAFANQVAYCTANGAPQTARICAAIGAVVDAEVGGGGGSAFVDRIRRWTGPPIADALTLRAAAGLHALYLAGVAPELGVIYAGGAHPGAAAGDVAAGDFAAEDLAIEDFAIVARVIAAHDAALLPWLDGPPQTNEAGRSANFIGAMLWLAGRGVPADFACIEIGSSAGINLMLGRYFYDLGGVRVGPADAALRFVPEWIGPPPPDVPIRIASTRGCDVAPVDLTDPAAALRLSAYIWPEHHVRFERMATAVRLAHADPPDLVRANAADFVEAELAKPQAPGTTRVLMHSIVWQYVPADQQARVTAAMLAAGAAATADRPLAWIALEANRTVHRHELVVRLWRGADDDGAPVKLGTAHAHGAWLDWSRGLTEV